MSIHTSLSITEPCTTDGSIRLRVVSSAPDSAEHAALRTFYRDCDTSMRGRSDYTPYDGWIPPQTAQTISNIVAVLPAILETEMEWHTYRQRAGQHTLGRWT